MQKRAILSLVVLLIFIVGALPLLSMITDSLFLNGHFSLAAYRHVLTSARQWKFMGNSFLLSLLVTLITVGVGVPLGLILGRTDLPLRRVLTACFVVPILIPPYIPAVAWSGIIGNGTAAKLLFGLPGCTMVLSTVFLPIPMLLTLFALRSINPRQEEAGLLVSGWFGVLRGITLPLIMPSIILSAMLVFILTFGEFSVPNYLRYAVYPTQSFIQFAAFYDFKAATARAMPPLAVTALIICMETIFLRRKLHFSRPAANTESPATIKLGAAVKTLVFMAVGLTALVLVVLPLGALLQQAGSLHVYIEALQIAGDSLMRSLLYAALIATIISILGFFAAYMIFNRAMVGWFVLDLTIVFLFALPGSVLGIGLITLWNTPYTNFIYNTPLILIFGCVAKYLVFGSRISAAWLARIPPSYEEAAKLSGAGWYRSVTEIVLPQARRGLLIAWMTGCVFAMRDTGISMLVYPAGRDTLPVRIFTLMANGSDHTIAALCVIMIAATLLPAAGLWIMLNIRKENH